MSQSRVAMVTGGGGGIGAAMASAVAARGIRIAVTDIDLAAAEKVALDINKAHGDGSAIALAHDVSREADCKRAVGDTIARLGSVDILFNNAGISVSSFRGDAETNLPSISEVTPDLMDRFYRINFMGAVHMIRATVPGMVDRGWGRVINNTTSFITMLRVLPYGPLKAALEASSAVWAEELKDTGVTVNVLVPGGPTDTPFIHPDAGIPREKMLQPSVMGPPAAWLASPESNGITGKRYIAGFWNTSLPEREAARESGAPIGWPDLAAATRLWPGQEPGKGPGQGI
ncbi:MAG: SDR family oxidoreductase [Nisaea sp.]|uniref:SDR family NAD(P)-dependent oxidoreductase n=1 Tax=Nisaea sp. TaxID=2024842 RepID=UPI001B257E34|nr:SDR family oxidoreductase [Nisaea sp.]MBO6560164.1 SDR family oxidoreductase [Nisaea sp.]